METKQATTFVTNNGRKVWPVVKLDDRGRPVVHFDSDGGLTGWAYGAVSLSEGSPWSGRVGVAGGLLLDGGSETSIDQAAAQRLATFADGVVAAWRSRS